MSDSYSSSGKPFSKFNT